MGQDLRNYIGKLLDKQNPVLPFETGVKEQITSVADLKVIIFDIYGTLLVSSSGDVDQSDFNINNIQRALIEGGYIIFDDIPQGAFQFMIDDFKYTILEHHKKKKAKGIPFPEINISEVWSDVLERAEKKVWIKKGKHACVKQFVITFEVLSNQVYPMPGMQQIIDHLKELNIPLGIVSNAQFYTPLIMNHYLKNESGEEAIPPFDPDLTVFSFKLGKGKPDSFLYESLIPALKKKYNAKPSEVLFVGNDMLNDVYAANKAGFKTALFAGDQRSLRWRKDKVNGLKPDLIITDLQQLKKVISK
jgi:putative hydrolase of the HAD superfamily